MWHASCFESNFAFDPHGLQLSGIFICGMPAAMNLILHVALTGCSFQAFHMWHASCYESNFACGPHGHKCLWGVLILICVSNHNRTEDWSMLPNVKRGFGWPVDSIFPLQPWLYTRAINMYLLTFVRVEKEPNECCLLLIHSIGTGHYQIILLTKSYISPPLPPSTH